MAVRNFQRSLIALLMLVILHSMLWSRSGICQAQQGAVNINRVEDVILQWRKDQHLYVRGELGISTSQLKKLEQWLDENASNWTIVLMNQATDESYRSLDNRRFSGMDAVEYALGHGLANRTDFGSLVHPSTGETIGAVFVLFLAERKFSFYGSDAHDRRGLGEAHWVGELDREAKRAMRSGGRIIDAVKNTVTSINDRLEKKIELEESAAEQAIAARERARQSRLREIENLKSEIVGVESDDLQRVESSRREILENFEDAKDSNLANPPIKTWRQQLESMRLELDTLKSDLESEVSRRIREIKSEFHRVRGETDQYLDAYASHESFAILIGSVEQRLDQMADHPSGAGLEVSAEAYRLLDSARLGHAQGNLTFAEPIELVNDLIEQGEQAVLMEQRRLQGEVERRRVIGRTLGIAGSVLAAAILGMLWWLNVRRRSSLRRAHSQFDKRATSVRRELENFDRVVARAGEVLGARESFGKQNYQGQTLALGRKILQDIEDLAEISREAQRVLEACSELLHPANPIAEAANMFTVSRYEHCLNLLNEKSLRIVDSTGEHDAMGKPAWVTFETMLSQWHARSASTTAAVESFSQFLENVETQIAELQAKISQATELEQELSNASLEDHYFQIPAMFEDLIPSAQLDLERAVSLATADPIQATQGEIALGMRKIDDGIFIAQTVKKARDVVFDQLDDASATLQELGFDIKWIDQRVHGLGDQADKLLQEATTTQVHDEGERFASDVVRLGQRARRCVELAQQVDRSVVASLDALEQRIHESRATIAAKLGIDSSAALREPQYDPDDDLEQARNQLQSARAALDYGGVESVLESLEFIAIESDQANRLIDSSLAAMKDFKTEFRARKDEFNSLVAQLPKYESLIDQARSQYAGSALQQIMNEPGSHRFDADVVGVGERNIVALFNLCKQVLDRSRTTVETALGIYQTGRLLEAANSAQLVQEEFLGVKAAFDQIENHCKLLAEKSVANKKLLRRQAILIQSLEHEVSDKRAQIPTQKQLSELAQRIRGFEASFSKLTDLRDPISDANRMAEFEAGLNRLAAMLRSDHQAFAEATKAVGGAEQELMTAQRLAAGSANDRIPDSQGIQQAQREVSKLEIELERLSKRLDVPHDNWRTIDLEATQVNSKLALVSGQLRSELELAHQAVEALSQAAERVYAAANWRGAFDIAVSGSPGSGDLQQARERLAIGRYHESIRLSRSAEQSSCDAIAEAEHLVQQKQRETDRRAAEARRRRLRHSTLQTIGGSISGESPASSGITGSRTWSSSSRSRARGNSTGSGDSNPGGSSTSGFRRSGW